jgi:sulfonate transport system permease protein
MTTFTRLDRQQTIQRGKRLLISAVVPLLVLALWVLCTRTGWIPPSIIASPTQVLQSAEKLIYSGALPYNALVSLRRLSLGFLAGLIPAFCAGTIVGYSRLFEHLLALTISLIAPIPITAWIPLVIVIAGVGELSKCAVIAIGVFFPIYFATVSGIRGTDPKLIEVARIFEKKSVVTLLYVLLPSAVESIFLGIRQALGVAWVLLIVAEVIASSAGIGWLMWDARNFARPGDMMVAMITAGVLGSVTTGIISALQRAFVFWKPQIECGY